MRVSRVLFAASPRDTLSLRRTPMTLMARAIYSRAANAAMIEVIGNTNDLSFAVV
jgi:hypothetical protein